MALTRSAMAEVSFSWDPMGMLTLRFTMPWSMSGISTILVFTRVTPKRTTRAKEASIPRKRWWTK